MNKKTILYLRTDIINEKLTAGGSVAHTLGVINGLIQLGHHVVCASSVMGPLLEKIQGCTFVQLKQLRWLSFLRWKLNCLVSTPFFTWQTYRLLSRHSFSFIYQRYSILNCTGVLLSKLKKIPLVLEYNGSETWVEKNWSKKRKYKFLWLIESVERYNLKHAHKIVVVSRALKDELEIRGIDVTKVLVNPNGVDAEIFDASKLTLERTKIRTLLEMEQKFVFGFVGSFSAWHGIELMAQMIPRVIKLHDNVFFLLVGDGQLREYLQRELQRHVITRKHAAFVGRTPQNVAQNYLAACDAFLSPTKPNADGTRFFGSPTKLFEYMSMAKPVIASDLEQLAEVITPAIKYPHDQELSKHACGVLVNPLDVDAFVQAVSDTLKLNSKDLTALGSRARQKVVAHYTWKMHVEKILQHAGEH